MEENMIAKKNKTEAGEESTADTQNGTSNDANSVSDNTTTGAANDGRPELPEEEAGMGPMNGDFPGGATVGMATTTNEWLIPMSCAGIISGAIILAAAAVCGMIWKIGKKVSK